MHARTIAAPRFLGATLGLVAAALLIAACVPALPGEAMPARLAEELPAEVELGETELAMQSEAEQQEAIAAAIQAKRDGEQMEEAEPLAMQSALTPEQSDLLAGLQNRGPAPELHNEVWLNSEPLKLADLQGKVVLVEFWTYGCINCVNVIPSVRAWHEEYAGDGLVVIGVHTPEFAYEHDLANVQAALKRLDVPYPVAIDNDWATWRAYHNRFWPAMYLIDKTGDIRHVKIGEGQYDHTESIIQALLAERSLDNTIPSN